MEDLPRITPYPGYDTPCVEMIQGDKGELLFYVTASIEGGSPICGTPKPTKKEAILDWNGILFDLGE